MREINIKSYTIKYVETDVFRVDIDTVYLSSHMQDNPNFLSFLNSMLVDPFPTVESLIEHHIIEYWKHTVQELSKKTKNISDEDNKMIDRIINKDVPSFVKKIIYLELQMSKLGAMVTYSFHGLNKNGNKSLRHGNLYALRESVDQEFKAVPQKMHNTVIDHINSHTIKKTSEQDILNRIKVYGSVSLSGSIGVEHIWTKDITLKAPFLINDNHRHIGSGEQHTYNNRDIGIIVYDLKITQDRIKVGGFVFGKPRGQSSDVNITELNQKIVGAKITKGEWKQTSDKDSSYAVSKQMCLETIRALLNGQETPSYIHDSFEVIYQEDKKYILALKNRDKKFNYSHYVLIEDVGDTIHILGQYSTYADNRDGMSYQHMLWIDPKEVVERDGYLNFFKRYILMEDLAK